MNKGLRLRVAACKSDVNFPFEKGNDVNFDRCAQRIVNRKQRPATIEVNAV
jgi:hypothetical protein